MYMCTRVHVHVHAHVCMCVHVYVYGVMCAGYLVVRVGYHWRFPLSIHVLIPVLRHLGIRVSNVLGLIPFLWCRDKVYVNQSLKMILQHKYNNIQTERATNSVANIIGHTSRYMECTQF